MDTDEIIEQYGGLIGKDRTTQSLKSFGMSLKAKIFEFYKAIISNCRISKYLAFILSLIETAQIIFPFIMPNIDITSLGGKIVVYNLAASIFHSV